MTATFQLGLFGAPAEAMTQAPAANVLESAPGQPHRTAVDLVEEMRLALAFGQLVVRGGDPNLKARCDVWIADAMRVLKAAGRFK